jgi:hypothetical protein
MTIAIERMEALEQRVGVELDRICAWADEENQLCVCGEVRLVGSSDDSFQIIMSAHDAAGRVIGATSNFGTAFDRGSIYQMTVFRDSISTNRPAADVVKVRVYPQRED